MLKKFVSWFESLSAKTKIFTALSLVMVFFLVSGLLTPPKNTASPNPETPSVIPEPSESPPLKPRLPNTCIDFDESVVSTNFNIEQARLKKKGGNLLLFLDASFVDTSQGAASSGTPIPVTDAQGGWVMLALQSDLEQENFMFVIANGKVSIPDWTSRDFTVEVTGTELGVKVLFRGPGIEKMTSGPFDWAVATRDQQNFWDLCPDQEYSFSLKRFLSYSP